MQYFKKFTKKELEEIVKTEKRKMFLWKKEGIKEIPIKELAKIALNSEKEPLDEETVLKTADFYTRNKYILRILAAALDPSKRYNIVIEFSPEDDEKTIWPDREYASILPNYVVLNDLQDKEYKRTVLYVIF